MNKYVPIRYKLVIRLDKTVCENLQLKTDMTSEKAKKIVLHHELTKKQNEGDSAQLDVVKFKKKERFKDQQSSKPASTSGHNRTKTNESRSRESQHNQKTQFGKGCGKCGRSHAWGSCPALGKKCYKFQKNNHFGKMCRHKQIEEKELERIKAGDFIDEINEPPDRVSPMVPVINPLGEVRFCVNLKNLNEYVERERYFMSTMDDIIYKFKDSRVFLKLDAAAGYHQIPLEKESAKLTTVITPRGRYYFTRLPLGISSGPEIFEKLME